MKHILLAPHHDDETLFAAYTILLCEPLVVTVFGVAETQEQYGILGKTRSKETAQALWWLGDPEWQEWPISDLESDFSIVESHMFALASRYPPDITVHVPMGEHNGHEQHNAVSLAAKKAFYAGTRIVEYATYRRGSGRTKTENELVPEPDWPARKFRAMACYESQINLPNTRPWFEDWSREWKA